MACRAPTTTSGSARSTRSRVCRWRRSQPTHCALLLWCTGPHVAIGTHVKIIEAWGFKPSTIAFVWVKENKTDGRVRTRGQGCWTTANAEFCFIATKGSPLRLAFDVHQVVMAPVGEHSKKPAAVRQRIQRLFGGPYLELFGREAIAGWTTWGNEIPREQFGSPILDAAESRSERRDYEAVPG